MIDFTCPQCHAAFSVPEHLGGRRARCKKCGTPLAIPGAEVRDVLIEPEQRGPRLPPRTRRLKADADQMRQAFENFPPIKIRSMHGDPPDSYIVEYFVKGLERIPGRKDPIDRHYHLAEIKLISEYPRLGPQCKMLTPCFHPNIEPATICVGDHWTAGERLVDLVVRIGEMICYQAYNIKSPLDGEAAMWADLHMKELPVDDRALRPPGMD
jgi:ubiquitin-protein ligase